MEIRARKRKSYINDEFHVTEAETLNFETGICPVVDTVSEKAMAPHSSTLAWKIPWTEEPGRLQSMGLRRVRHD